MGNKQTVSRDQNQPNQEIENGPATKRGCTDILCLILFLAFIGGWIFVAILGFTYGDIDKIIYPSDSKGNICGQGDLKSKPNLLFFDLTKCLNLAVVSLGCPTVQTCVMNCPQTSMKFERNDQKSEMKPYCVANMSQQDFNTKSVNQLIQEKQCPPFILKSEAKLGRCIPVIDENIDSSLAVMPVGNLEKVLKKLSYLFGFAGFTDKAYQDIKATWWMIGLGLVVATLLSFIWIFLLRLMAGIMVWTTISIFFLLCATGLGFSVYQYLQLDFANNDTYRNILQVDITPFYFEEVLALQQTWIFFMIILSLFTFIILLVIIALRQRLQIAIQLIKEGAKAAGTMCCSYFFPIIPFVLHVLVATWFVVLALSINSIGDPIYTVQYEVKEGSINSRTNLNGDTVPDQPCECNHLDGNPYLLNDICNPTDISCSCPEITCQFTGYGSTKENRLQDWKIWYNLFGFFWLMAFVSAFNEMVLAGSYTKWYWTRNKDDITCCTCSVGASIFNALFYHTGTLAFGSLIIAIIHTIQTILDFVEQKLKKYDNDLTKCLLCCCKGCWWCMEKIFRYLNKNIYIMTAMNGTNFWNSGKRAFELLFKNPIRALVLSNSVRFVMFIGKLVIMGGNGALSYFVFTKSIPEIEKEIPNLNNPFIPMTIIVIGTYFIASAFFDVYSMAVDTLFLCFLEDEKIHKNNPELYYMPDGLRKIIDNHKAKQKKRTVEQSTPENIPLRERRELHNMNDLNDL